MEPIIPANMDKINIMKELIISIHKNNSLHEYHGDAPLVHLQICHWGLKWKCPILNMVDPTNIQWVSKTELTIILVLYHNNLSKIP